ncbi:MAG: NFACT family protein [Thermoplasmatales archaeon]|nr:NFACT family protein [Thermoplasmatales archaeon]
MQRQLSSFDIYVIVSDLQELIGSYIDKINHLSRDEILIRVRKRETKQKEQIFIRNGELISLTQKQFETPLKPTSFVMALRKYLLNGRIAEITQHEFDRIIKIKISKKEGVFTLIFEFFSDGNIVLVNPDEKIILPFIRQTWAHRSVKGKESYVPPPSQINPLNLTKEKFSELIKESNADLVRTLAVNISLSGPIAEEICAQADIDKKLEVKNLNDDDISKTFKALTKFLEIFKSRKFEPVFVKKDGDIIDILPFKFESYKDFNFEKTDRLSRGLEKFIEKKKVKKKEESNLEKLIGKLNRQLSQQMETVKKLKGEIEIKKFEGDLIYLNYREIEELLKEINKVLNLKEKDDEIKRINELEIVKVFNPKENLLIVNLKDTSSKKSEVKLNFRKTVSENAEKSYDDNKKFRSKLKGAEKSISKTKEEIEKVKKREELEKKQEEEKKIVKKEKLFWFERFRWFISSDGNVVVAGKDAKGNEQVVKKYLKEGDRYAHADIQGAPSCIIKNTGIDGKETSVSEKTLEEACIFAAGYSKAWKQFAEAQAYWVLPEQVSKTAQSGEFVPKGAFIIRGKRNYYRCKLELAVGKITIDDVVKIMGGPVDAVKKRADEYIILVPGSMKKNVIAHKLSKAFNISTDQIDRALPPGGVTVVETVGIELK